MRRIVVLIHRHGAFESEAYYLTRVAELLREDGLEVVVARGPDAPLDADLAVLHVDQTVVPPDHLDFLRRFPVVVNGRVHDISKRRLSRLLLKPGDAYDGPVIVKADRNNGGLSEARLAQKGFLPASDKIYVPEYALLDSAADVDPAIWEQPDLVVERFEPEMVDGLFCLRMWKFLGDRETHTLAFSRHPIVKGKNVIRREEGGSVPEELRAIRRELGFDYGKFDYGLVDGRPVLYDANRTPTYSRPIEEELPRIRSFAEGLKSFV